MKTTSIPNNEIWCEITDKTNIVCPTDSLRYNICVGSQRRGKYVVIKFTKPIVWLEPAMFRMCSRIKKIILPSTVESIGRVCFSYCDDLVEINIPTLVKKIKSNAFEECWNLKKVVVGNSVTTIEKNAFFNCSSLEEVYLPASLETIDKQVFLRCGKLTKINYDGTISEWKAIPKGEHWHSCVPRECNIHCKDGIIPIENT